MAVRSGLAAGAAAAGPVGIAIGVLAAAAMKAADSLNHMTKEQLDFNRALGHASAQMAFVFAERDIQERMRNREKGDRLADSARTLTQAEQFRADNTKEIDILWNKTKNLAGAAWEEFKGGLFMELNKMAGIGSGILDGMTAAFQDHGPAGSLTMDEYVRDLAQQDAESRKRKDPRWEPPKFR